MTSLPFLAQQLFNRPLAIRPEKAEIIMAALADRFGVTSLRLPDGRIRAFDYEEEKPDTLPAPDSPQGYDVAAGVALIAAKSLYFGVGGGTRAFEAAVAADGALVSRRAALFRDGASNVREILELRWRSGEGADAAGSVDAGRAR